MGWALKGSRQKLVVCRYEEESARGVSCTRIKVHLIDSVLLVMGNGTDFR